MASSGERYPRIYGLQVGEANRFGGSQPKRTEACAARAAAADEIIVATGHPGYDTEVLRLTGGPGVDFTMNHMTGELNRHDPRAPKYRGKILLINFTTGFPEVDREFQSLITNKSPGFVMCSSVSLDGTDEHRPALDYLTDWLHTEKHQKLTQFIRSQLQG